jgi:hypothetical protein
VKGIFISYRRDDAAGHAGRLFDGLKEHFGADHVFMDVSDLRPGQDFMVELERALGGCDYLLAVIGPRWLDAVDAKGRRRLDDPDDFVRREVSTALASRTTVVIPVLVHGARMPPAESLPEALKALARRQAIELTDQRWESDVRELIGCLAEDAPAWAPAAATAPSGTRAGSSAGKAGAARKVTSIRTAGIGPGTIAILVLGLAVAAAGVWMLLRPDAKKAEVATFDGARRDAREGNRDPGTRAAREDTGRDATSTRAASGTDPERKPGESAPSADAAVKRDMDGAEQRASVEAASASVVGARFAIARPELSDVKFRTNRAVVSFSILGIQLEPRDAETQVLTFLIRMLNQGPLDEYFGSDQFRLVSGEQAIKPENTEIGSTEAVSAKEVQFRFIAPANLPDPALQVRVNAESTRIPISLAARTPVPADGSVDGFGRPIRPRLVEAFKPLPASLPAGQRAQVGKVEYQIVDATLERDTVEKASLTLTVRCSVPPGGVAVNFWSSSVRLWIDGVPRAPVNDVNEVVDRGDSKDARFVFEIVSMPQSLEIGLNHSGDRVRVPLPLAAAAKQ